MSRVLIAGCGDVGMLLGRRLVQAGYDVFGIRRRTELLATEIEPVQVDLYDEKSMRRLPGAVEYVVYAASADEASETAYENAYVRGPRNLINALNDTNTNLKRVIYVSSTRVYSQTNGQWVNECSQTKPVEFRANALMTGERYIRSCGVRAISLRLAGIYGAGRRALIRRVQAGTSCIEKPPRYTNRIHREDCAGVLQHLLELNSPDSTYIGVDHAPAPQCEVMDWIAEQIGVPYPSRIGMTSKDYAPNKRCSNRRLTESGYRFRYPTYREGYASILENSSEKGPLI